MSDYELVDLLFQDIAGIQDVLVNFVAVLFAFLVASYLVAEKLDRLIVIIVVTMFTLVTCYHMLASIGLGHDFEGLMHALAERAGRDESNIGWHSSIMEISDIKIRDIGLPIMRFAPTFVIVVSYIGGVIFFFRQRHLGRKRQE